MLDTNTTQIVSFITRIKEEVLTLTLTTLGLSMTDEDVLLAKLQSTPSL